MDLSLKRSRRNVLALGAGLGTAMLATRLGAAPPRPVIIELFTSQGCSSCPPADAFLDELKSSEGVIAMSFNVDYWDYLGWRDTLASPAFSQRQYDYAKTRGDMDVYTPQIVVDGASHFVGSNRAVVKAAIDRSLGSSRATWIPMKLASDSNAITIAIDAVPNGMHAPDATVWFMAIAPRVAVEIERGENSGRDIVYSNVVRKLVPAGMWHGEALSVSLPRADLMADGSKGCVALLQTHSVGPVIGCASWGEVSA